MMTLLLVEVGRSRELLVLLLLLMCGTRESNNLIEVVVLDEDNDAVVGVCVENNA